MDNEDKQLGPDKAAADWVEAIRDEEAGGPPEVISEPEAILHEQVESDGAVASLEEAARPEEAVDAPDERSEPEASSPHEAKSSEVRTPSFFEERDGVLIALSEKQRKLQTRRDFLLFGAGSLAAAAGFWSVLPAATQLRVGRLSAMDSAGKERLLNRALNFDDDVAEAIYSRNRTVRTYSKSQLTELRNNYAGLTPDASYISEWSLTLEGLASASIETLTMRVLRARFPLHEQITRLVCVEGWSAIAWWDGFPFAELLRAFPPASQSRFARVESGINLDGNGNPDPYYVSMDMKTLQHPQALLATHFKGEELGPEHGAPLRLVVPMKLGLKNVKAITKITYTAEAPADYWAEKGYSRFDGL